MRPHPFPLPSLANFTEFLCIESALLPHELDQLEQIWLDSTAKDTALQGEGSSPIYAEDLRRGKGTGVDRDESNGWIFDRLMMHALGCNREAYGFDILGFYEPLQLASYGEGDFFDWHLDYGAGPSSNRKLSLSVQLSEDADYEGGDLQFKINQREINAPRKRGTMIVFPSFIMHRVTPVTKGERKSLVGWVSGPPYR